MATSEIFPVAQASDDEVRCADCNKVVDKDFIVLEGVILCLDCVDEVDEDDDGDDDLEDDDLDDDSDDDLEDDDGDYDDE